MSLGREKFSVLAVYRSPSTDRDLELFISDLEQYYEGRSRDSVHWLIGDINCCILEDNRTLVSEHYLDVLYGAGFTPCITKATRVTPQTNTCIDHIFVNLKVTDNVSSLVVDTGVTDHYATAVEWKVSVGEELANKIPTVDCVVDDERYQVQTEFQLEPVTEEQLANCVRELRGGSAPGIDEIAADMIKTNFECIKKAL
ncbi:hypothetical protein J6590_075718 [Homalodisca vitripennis]|nr:hypothetical protein J6590_075718 [Homalodisca vitripennis]